MLQRIRLCRLQFQAAAQRCLGLRIAVQHLAQPPGLVERLHQQWLLCRLHLRRGVDHALPASQRLVVLADGLELCAQVQMGFEQVVLGGDGRLVRRHRASPVTGSAEQDAQVELRHEHQARLRALRRGRPLSVQRGRLGSCACSGQRLGPVQQFGQRQ